MALDMHDIGKAIFETSQELQKGAKTSIATQNNT